MMKNERARTITATGIARNSLPTESSGEAMIQPMMPPPLASVSMPLDGCGWPPPTWQSAAMLDSMRIPPIPMRVLS